MFGSLHDVALDMGLTLADAQALERELTRGWNAQLALEKQREIEAGKQAAAMRNHRTVEGLGKCVLALSQVDYERVVSQHGYDAFSDRGFIKDMQRLEPSTKVFSA
jgi:hypothetical protein